MVSRISRSVPVTVNDVLDGHVALDLQCLDRLYLHGYLGQLQVGGQVIQFLQHRGYPVPSPACLQQIGDAFRRRVASFAEANHIPVVTLKAADRNIEVMKPYLDKAAATGRSQVAAIGVAQEPQRVFIARQRHTDPGKCPQFSFDKKDRRVTVYYFYLWDAGFGPAFIKICTYCPWPVKIWVNGHEWAKQQARKIGFAFTELSNGFASAEDPAVLQRICDALQPGTISVFFQRWLARLPLPLGAADQRAGYWWECSMAQVEVSRTIVFTQPRHARAFFEALVTDNLDLGRPNTVEIIFGRRIINGRQRATRGTFKTKVITRGTEVTINAFYRHSRIKQYLKDGRALRIETVINSPTKAQQMFEPTCARRRLKLTGWRAGCLGPGQPRRAGRRRGPCRGPRRRAWGSRLATRSTSRVARRVRVPMPAGSSTRTRYWSDAAVRRAPGVSGDDHVRVAGGVRLPVLQAALQRVPAGRVERDGVRPGAEPDRARGHVDVGDLEVTQILGRRGVQEREQAGQRLVRVNPRVGGPAAEQAPLLGDGQGTGGKRRGRPARIPAAGLARTRRLARAQRKNRPDGG